MLLAHVSMTEKKSPFSSCPTIDSPPKIRHGRRYIPFLTIDSQYFEFKNRRITSLRQIHTNGFVRPSCRIWYMRDFLSLAPNGDLVFYATLKRRSAFLLLVDNCYL